MSMTMTGAPRAPRKITGKTVLFGFFAFFGVIISVNMVFVYFALTTWPGLTTEDSYMKGINYNQTLADGERQTALGWRTDVTLGQNGVLVRVEDRDGVAISGHNARIEIARPLGDEEVVRVALTETAPGQFTASFLDKPSGRYVATVLIDDADGNLVFQMRHKLIVR